MQIDLAGKVAIVTGAGRGIGETVAMTLASEGVKVLAVDCNKADLDALAERAKLQTLNLKAYHCDISSKSAVQEMTAFTAQHFGRIDILVNNAGIVRGGFLDVMEENDWDAVMDVNCKGAFLCAQAVIPYMKKQRWGRIINAASFAGMIASVEYGGYAISKAAVVSMTRVLAGELGPWNITANAYAPGMVPTDMNKMAEAPREKQERHLNMIALHRFGQKEDIANLVAFLSSDLAGYITGALIDISGGKLIVQEPGTMYTIATND